MGSRLLLVGVLSLACVGCVGTRQKKDTTEADAKIAKHNEEAAPENKLVCRRERVMGSNRTERVCRRKGDRDRERDGAGDMIRRQTPGGPGPGEY